MTLFRHWQVMTKRYYNTFWSLSISFVLVCLLCQSNVRMIVTALRSPSLVLDVRNNQQQLVTIPKNYKILILPGFGNDSSDYYLENIPSGSFIQSLIQRGWDRNTQLYVLPVQRYDWLQVFWNGLFDPMFWFGTAPPTRPAFQWYLRRVITSIHELTQVEQQQQAQADQPTGSPAQKNAMSINGKRNNKSSQKDSDYNEDDIQIILIGHSAGGWLARAALGYGSTGDASNGFPAQVDLRHVAGLVTLGAPNLPPPAGVMDMTRGALPRTSSDFPGAYHSSSRFGMSQNGNNNNTDNNTNLFYITVIGDAVQGVPPKRNKASFVPETTTTTTSTASSTTMSDIAAFAYNSYQAVCGNGSEIGDGVVPIVSAHLDGAVKLNLTGVYHSINVPDRWYGSDTVIDSWHSILLHQMNQKRSNSNTRINSFMKQSPLDFILKRLSNSNS